MSVVPQLDFCFYPSQVFWFLCTFLLLYLVVQRVVVPRLEATLGLRLARHRSALDKAQNRCDKLQRELLKQKISLEQADLRAGYLERCAQGEVVSIIEETKSALKNELDEMTKDVDAMLYDRRNREREDLVALSTEIALLYCSKMSFGIDETRRKRMRQLVAEMYGEKLC